MINPSIISKLREQTGAGIMDVKRALEVANGDENKALENLKIRGIAIAEKKQAERETKDGLIDSYIHNNGKTGALIKLTCETDFVAKNEEFKNLAHDIAMQVTAMNPANLEELLEQSFIKNPEKKISDLITEATAKLGEKIELKKIIRFEI
jgi:elongation factor Ts